MISSAPWVGMPLRAGGYKELHLIHLIDHRVEDEKLDLLSWKLLTGGGGGKEEGET